MKSYNYRKFKKEIGQANHFLITIMVGLDAVEDGAQKRETFNTTWNPKSVVASSERSRQYAIKSALTWTVDNLDMYLRLCNREPRLYDDDTSIEFSKTKHSVYKKFILVTEKYTELSTDKCAYVDLLICWRNNSVHFDADNQLSDKSRNYFNDIPKDDIPTNKYHLNVIEMLERFTEGKCPTLKEATTLISMTIHFVEELDSILLKNVQQYKFLEYFLHKLLNTEKHKPTIFDHKNSTPEKKKKALKQLFATVGICDDFYNDDGLRFLDDVSNQTEIEFESRFK